MNLKEAMKRGLLSKEGIESEMSWLRCIDMDNENKVKLAALEIKMAIINAKESK